MALHSEIAIYGQGRKFSFLKSHNHSGALFVVCIFRVVVVLHQKNLKLRTPGK
jgi:hypothetical protein